MNTTTILEPFDQKHSELDRELYATYINHYYILREFLTILANKYKDDSTAQVRGTTLNDILEWLTLKLDRPITLDDYYLMLRASLKSRTVFLKRTCRELMLNQYNTEIILRHRANMDIQHVTDPYGVAVYVSAYLTEYNKHLSATLKKAQEQIREGNKNMRKRLHGMANVFQNSTEMGAQECVYQLLSMPVCKSTRKTIFINTYRSKDRTLMLKETKWLEMMNPAGTDVFKSGILDQYKLRSRENPFQEMCLAEYASQWLFVTGEAVKNMCKTRENRSLPAPFENEVYIEHDEDIYLDESDEGNFLLIIIFMEFKVEIFSNEFKY